MDFTFNNNIAFYDESSVLDISKIVEWKKSNNAYNFESLPKTAIISLNKNILSRKLRLLSKKSKGLTGENYFVNKNLIFCSNLGNGSPAIVSFMEELRILGVEKFVFIGLAGSLVSTAIEGEVFLVKNTFSTVGCTSLYTPNNNFEPIESGWYTSLKDILSLNEAICWSTDAPFRETKSLLTYFIEKGTTHVDMECAAVYAFGAFYKLCTLCLIITADSFVDFNWFAPKSKWLLNQKMKTTFESLKNIL